MAFARLQTGIIQRVQAMLMEIGEDIVGISRENYLSGPRSKSMLGVVSGSLRRSVTYAMPMATRGTSIEVGSNLPYAAVHEFGATIRAKSVRGLVFKVMGVGWRRAQQVTIPARPFLAPALRDAEKGMIETVQRHVNAAIEEALGQ